MASLERKVHQYSLLAVLVALSLSAGASGYYNGHHYQHQQRHLSSHRHQMSHRPSQSHYLSSPGSRSPSPQPPSPKYPNLDRLLHRLDAEAGKSGALVATTTTSPMATTRRDVFPSFLRPTASPPLSATPVSFATPATPHRLRHHPEELYDESEEEDDEDDDEELRAGYHHDQRDPKLAWDLKFNLDANYQKQQAAGGGGGGSLSLGSLSSGTSFSDRKWQVLGNRDNLEQFRRRKLGPSKTPTSESEIREAVQHALRVSREGSCKIPRPRVVQVKSIYPHPSKTYIPHCTILHQCGDDTGCCRHESLSCVPISTHRVELHFYTTTLGSYQGNTVEKLVFYNHTECECQDKKEDLMPRDPAKSSDFSTRHYRHPGNTARMDPYGPAPLRSSRIDRTPDPPPTKDCKCPSLFSVRHPSEPNESCTCDCFDKQQDCIRAKRGKEYFSLQDRLCIQSEDCVMPECEFGIYLRRAGRCPRKREKLAAFHRYSPDEYK